MPRVVCPLCRTGFEANISRDNFAVNCVSCGVAFSAASFLSKQNFSGEHAVAPASVPAGQNSGPVTTGTNNGRLPFMTDSSFPAVAARKPHETSLPVLPADKENKAPQEEVSAQPKVAAAKAEKTGDPVKAPTENVSKPPQAAPVTPPPVALPPEKSDAQMAAPAPKPAKPKNTTRRPVLEGSFGPFEIEGEIARGGVGAVFRARERDSGRVVALKVLLDGAEAGETDRERFQHECETAKALSLPGMVQVYLVGEIDEKPFMAMELVDGRSLDKVIPEKSLSVNDCLVLMKSVAETIGALHEAGYVHRDLKPGNILIDAFGSPKVADFGLVKSLDEVTRMTASGLVCGTPAYMAPEQARGDGKAVDPRSDVWALGAVLYEMLTARPPFQADNALRLMLKITKEQPPVPRALNVKVPQDVQFIVMKCLEKNPERRYPNARALAVDIGRFLDGQPLESRPQPRLQQLLSAAAQNRRRLTAVGAGIAAVVVVAVLARLLLAPQEAGPLVEKGYQAINARALDVAERHFRDAVALDSRNARACLGLGFCLGRAGIENQKVVDQRKLEDALALTEQAGQLAPQLRADCHAQLACFKYWLALYESEAREMEQAVELASSNLKFHERLGLAYWRAGKQTQSVAYYKKAIQEFQDILKADPSYPKVYGYVKQLQDNFLAPQAGVQTTTMTARSRR